MSVQLSVQLSILSLPLVVDVFLFIYLGSQGLYETKIAIDSGLVVFIHPSLILIESAKVLLQIEQLILQGVIVSLPLSKFGCLRHQLGYEAFLLTWTLVAGARVLLHPN